MQTPKRYSTFRPIDSAIFPRAVVPSTSTFVLSVHARPYLKVTRRFPRASLMVPLSSKIMKIHKLPAESSKFSRTNRPRYDRFIRH